MKNTQNTNKALVEALVYNNRFASAKIDGEQIGVDIFVIAAFDQVRGRDIGNG